MVKRTGTYSDDFKVTLISLLIVWAPIIETKFLREIMLGEAEGKTKDDLIKIHGEHFFKTYLSVDKKDQSFCFLGGESKESVIKRTRVYLENFTKTNRSNNIAVCSHGGVVLWFAHNCTNAPLEPISILNCGLYHIGFDNDTWRFIGKIQPGIETEGIE